MQPLHLTPRVLVVELRPRPGVLQAAVLVGVEQAVEVEARRPLILSLQNRLGVVQSNPPDVLGERAVGASQVLRSGAQPTVRLVDLLDQRVAVRCRLLSSSSTFVPPILQPSARTPDGDPPTVRNVQRSSSAHSQA